MLTLADVFQSRASISALSTPTAEGEYTAGRRTVARAMRIGAWIWPSFTLLDVYMCYVAYPNAPFRLFVLYRVLLQGAFIAVYRASVRGSMPLKRLFWLQNVTYGACAIAIAC